MQATRSFPKAFKSQAVYTHDAIRLARKHQARPFDPRRVGRSCCPDSMRMNRAPIETYPSESALHAKAPYLVLSCRLPNLPREHSAIQVEPCSQVADDSGHSCCCFGLQMNDFDHTEVCRTSYLRDTKSMTLALKCQNRRNSVEDSVGKSTVHSVPCLRAGHWLA